MLLGAAGGANVVDYGNGEGCVVLGIISPRQRCVPGRRGEWYWRGRRNRGVSEERPGSLGIFRHCRKMRQLGSRRSITIICSVIKGGFRYLEILRNASKKGVLQMDEDDRWTTTCLTQERKVGETHRKISSDPSIVRLDPLLPDEARFESANI